MINPYWELIILLVLINIIFAQSLNIIIGYNGQFALGHAGFLAIGAYTSAILVVQCKVPLIIAVLAACVLTAFFGLLIGYPCVRLRGDYLAIATLGFAEIIRIVLLALPPDIFGGPTGIKNAPHISKFLPVPETLNATGNLLFTILFALVTIALAGWGIWSFSSFLARQLCRFRRISHCVGLARWIVLGIIILLFLVDFRRVSRTFLDIFQFGKAFNPQSSASLQWAVFALYLLTVLLVLWLMRNYINSMQGRAVIAIREDEIATTSLGINISWFKLMNFTVGSFFAGLSGALFAHTIPLFKPLDFNFFKSVDVLLMVVLGGMGSLPGATLGAGIITVLPEALRFVGQWRLVIYALLLVLFMIFRPSGILGTGAAAQLVVRKLIRRPEEGEKGA
ncbi:MAG: hypothetical protein A2Y63_05265 [Candidatus Riflebacteria bacterium RBG_13_59_9]|nr:MAG: hypothetical protein A2Y63_05265 [Candidatus Riflebacteria bacterium RBG_13_59_9]